MDFYQMLMAKYGILAKPLCNKNILKTKRYGVCHIVFYIIFSFQPNTLRTQEQQQ